MSGPGSLTVLILQYESADRTADLLASIEEQDRPNRYRFIVMDNGSRAPRLDELRQRFPWIEPVRWEENLGFARAHNRIMDAVSSRWLLLCNNDCLLVNDAITRTLEEAETVGADFATAALFDADGTPQRNFSSLPAPLRRILFNATGLTRLADALRRRLPRSRIGYANGAFLLLRRRSIPPPALFDERYFMYTEDLDLMIRLARAGAKGYRLAAGRVIHLGGASAVRRWDQDEIERRKALQTLDCYYRHYPAWQVDAMRWVFRLLRPGAYPTGPIAGDPATPDRQAR